MWQYNEKSLTSILAIEPHALKSEKKLFQVKQKRESEIMLRNQNCFLAQSTRSAETAGVNVSEIPLTSACLKPSFCRIFLVECAAKQSKHSWT